MGAGAPPPELLARFWELSRDLLAVADLDGHFVHVNHRWTEVTGHTTGELCARPFIEFVHPEDRARTLREAEEMAAAGRASISFENRYRCADGSFVRLLWNSYTSTSEGRIYAVATDVTALRQSQRFLATMQRVASAANEADDLATALSHALEEVCDLTGFPVGHAWVPEESDPGDAVLVPTAHWWLADEEEFHRLREVTADVRFRKGDGLPGRVWASGRPEWVVDVVNEPWWHRRPADELGVHAAFAFPVRSGDDLVAVLEFFAREPHEPDDALLDVIDHVGTQLGRVHERLEAIAAEQRAVEVEREFLSMLTHELRSPLLSIKGFIDLVLDRWEDFDDRQKLEFLERAGGSAQRMHRLVDEFLQLARHHAEGYAPRSESLEVRGMVDLILDEMSEGLPDVELDVPPDLHVHADEHFVQQILTNLLTNAERHGAPPITVDATHNGEHVTIAVRDHGEGVPPEFVPQLFERFKRADTTRPGTGLGLSICRDLTDAQGGDLDYEPASPGSRFTLSLPISSNDQSEREPSGG